MRKISRIFEGASYTSGYIAGWVVLGIMGLTMVEVVTRYVLHHPLILCDEFGAYSLVAISFLGLAYCWKERGHIRITFVVSRMPARVSNWLRVVTLTAALIYVSVASKVSYDFIVDAFRRNFRSSSWLMTPLKWPEMVIPIGFTILALVILAFIVKGIKDIRSGLNLEETNAEKSEEGSI